MKRGFAAWRWLSALVLLACVAAFVDLGSLWLELQRLPAWLIVPAFGLTIFQIALSAWRWRYTAGCLGLRLPYWRAFREYYLASLLNQVLPGGVMGDVSRAWRHSRLTENRREAIHSVLIERLSGQLALLLVVLWALAWLLGSDRVAWSGFGAWSKSSGVVMVVALVVAGVCIAGFLYAMNNRVGRYLRQLVRDVSRGLVGWRVLPVQLVSSLLVLASYLALFLVLAFGAGYWQTSGSGYLLAALCSFLLLSMVVPVTVAGWGVREGAAAVLWPLAGWPAEQGVALSVGYGTLVLLCSLPGLSVALLDRTKAESSRRLVRKTPDQTTYHCLD